MNASILAEIQRRPARGFAMHNLYHLLSRVLTCGVPGAIVELGSRVGWSAMLLRRTIEYHEPTRELHVFDAFEFGFEPPTLSDEGLVDGIVAGRGSEAFRAPERVLLENFARHGLEPPIVHAGWFRDTLADGLPERVAFVYLDADLYESIQLGLDEVYGRLSPGGVVVVDDCGGIVEEWPNRFPGVRRACVEFLSNKPEALIPLFGGCDPQAYFVKRG